MSNYKVKEINNLPNKDYHNSAEYAEFWSSSNIKNYLKSPKEAQFQKTESENKQTEAMHKGTLIHEFLESKHKYGEAMDRAEAPVNPSTNKEYGSTTKKYIAEVEKFGQLISVDEIEMLKSIWYSIQSGENKAFFDYVLNNGSPETSFLCTSEQGFKYKYRPDNLQNDMIVDFKKIDKRYFNEKGFKKAISDYGYSISASFYQYFEHKRTGIWKPFYIVWIMDQAPYDIIVHDIYEICYSTEGENLVKGDGAILFEQLKQQHESCLSVNHFPGLSNTVKKNKKGFRILNSSSVYLDIFRPFEVENQSF